MIEPNLIYLDSPSRRNILLSKDWRNNNDIQTLFRASEGEKFSTSFSHFLKYLNNIFFETNLIRICSLAVTGIASTCTYKVCLCTPYLTHSLLVEGTVVIKIVQIIFERIWFDAQGITQFYIIVFNMLNWN